MRMHEVLYFRNVLISSHTSNLKYKYIHTYIRKLHHVQNQFTLFQMLTREKLPINQNVMCLPLYNC